MSGLINKYYNIYLAALVSLFLLFSDVNAQSCSSTSRMSYEWPSHRNWLVAPGNLWTGQIVNMSTGGITSVGITGTTAVQTYEGTTCVSSDNGTLLFYANGRKIWSGTGGTTTLRYSGLLTGNEGGSNGTGSAVQGIITVRHPLDPNNYHIFTTDDVIGMGANLGFNYFKVSNNGSLISGPTRLTNGSGANFNTSEGVAATLHANGVDIWITCYEKATNNFNSYLLKCTGLVTTPVVSAVAPSFNGNELRGGLAFSFDGTKFAQAHPNSTAGQSDKEVSVYSFNNSTGVISNALNVSDLMANESACDITFSPSGNRVYYSTAGGGVYYYDISSGVAATIKATKTQVTGVSGGAYNELEIGPDGSLYYSPGSAVPGTITKIAGDLNSTAGNAFTISAVTGTTACFGLSSMYLPPAEEPDIQEVGPYCLGDPAVDLSTTWLCSGVNAEDATNYPTEYAGNGITNTGTGIFNPTTAGVGTHRIIFTRCSVDDTIWIVVNPKPNVTLSDQDLCTGSSATFDAGSGFSTYAWSGNGTGTSQTTTGSANGTYTVIVTNSNGCKDTASAILAHHSCCPDTSLSNIPSQCSNRGTINLNSYKVTTEPGTWSITTAPSGSTASISGSTFNVNTTVGGNYVVSYTITTPVSGCASYAERTILIKSKPNVVLTNATICSGDAAASFDAGAGYATYAWSGNGTGSSRTTTGTTAGTYTVRVVDANGCKDTSNATLTVNTKPNVTLTNVAMICSGDVAATFDAGSGYTTYAWSGNGIGSSRTTTGTTAGTYTVRVVDANGCKDTSSATLTVNTKPNVVLTNATICSGDAAATFDAGSGYTTYAWSANGTGSSRTTTGTIAGTYTVRVVDANGCKDTSSATLTVNAKPNVVLTNATICSGDAAATFDAGAGYTTYAWSGNGTGSSRTTTGTTAGTYTVRVVDANGCKDTSSSTLTVNTKPNVVLTNATICSGDAAATFDAGSGYTTYTWSANGTGSSRTTTGTTAGTYTVRVVDANGCKDTSSATLTVNTKPNVILTNATICSGDAAATFDAGSGYTTYAWSGNGIGSSRTTTGTTAGTYTVRVVDANGCKDTSSATLTVNTKPNVVLTNATICSGDAAATFDAGSGYTTYTWSANGTGSSRTTTGTTAGTYTVRVVDANGCKDTSSATLTVNTKPNVILTNATICSGDAAATFDAGSGYTTYAWSGNGIGSSRTTTGTTDGTYTVRVVDANGCKDTSSATLTVNTKPNVVLTNATICSGDAAATFDAGSGYTTYTWSANGTGSSRTTTGTTAGTYTVRVVDANGCKDTSSSTLTVNTKPNVVLTNATICSGDAAATFDAGSGYTTYAWSGNGTGSSRTTTGTTAGTYTVRVVDANGCNDTSSATLTVNTKPNVVLTNATICSGDAAATFDAGSGYTTYAWSVNGTGTSRTTTGTTAGTYTVRVVDANGCKDTSSATLTVNTKPNVVLTNATICSGDAAATFDAGAGYTTYAWSANGTGTSRTTTGTTAGTYTVRVADANGCKDTASATLTVNTKPNVTLTNVAICSGDPAATFDAGAGYTTYAWSVNGAGIAQTTSGTAAGTYTVRVVDANGCKDTSSATLTVNTKPNITLTNATICSGDAAASFDAGSGYTTYAWSANGTGSSRTTTGTTAGAYTVRVVDANGCKDTSSATLTVSTKPNVVLTNATICPGDAAASFDAGAGYTTYLWSGNGTGSSRTTTGTTAGTYTVRVVDANGCKDTSSAILTVNTKPNVVLTNATICSGDAAASFDAGAGYSTYAWSGNGTGSSRTTTGTAAGTYTVRVVDANGCKDTSSATLTVNAKPNITPPSATICAGASATFDAGAGYSAYAWSGPVAGSSQTIVATAAGTYQVIVTSGSSCKDTATAMLTVNAKPNVVLTNATICSGDAAATFDAGAGYSSYVWTGPSSGSAQTITGSAAGTYTVKVVDANGCKDTASATLTVNAKPNVVLTNATICSGDAAATFDAGAGFTSYTWSSNGTGTSRTTSGLTVGTYTVQVVDANGCKDTSSATLIVNTKPNVTLTNYTICLGDPAVTFDAGAGYSAYDWSANGTGTARTANGTTAGTYTVRVADANGCKDTASATLTVNTSLNINLTNATICAGETASFDAGAGFATYAWSGPATGSSSTISATVAGTYTVIVASVSGCKDTASATLTVNPLPTIYASGDTTICPGETTFITASLTGTAPYTLKATLGALTLTFNTSISTAILPLSMPGVYTLEVTDAKGCKNTKTLNIILNAKPNVVLTNATICAGDAAVTFDAGSGYTTYAWSANGTGASQTTSGNAAGTYTVRVADANGCKDTSSATLTVNSKPNVTLANATICSGDAAATFDAGAGYSTYTWSGNGTGSSRTATGTTAGTYTVSVVDASGCKDTSSATLTVNTKPNVVLANATICSGDAAATFDAGSAYTTYAWSGNGIGSSRTTTGKTAGTYTVRVVDANGCKDTSSATLTVNTKPSVTLTNATICSGDAAATFDAGAGYTTYAWTVNGTGATQTTSGTIAGTYTVHVIDANGCKDTASASLTVNALPVVNLGNDVEVCFGSPATLLDAGNSGSTYLWSNGSTSKTISTTLPNTYSVAVTNGNGCKGRDTVELIVNQLPVVDLGADRSICPGSTTTFDAGSGYTFYLWQDNSMNQTFNANKAGEYIITVIDGKGCSDSDTAKVIVSTNLTVALGADKAICVGAPAVVFDAGNTGATYLWSDGSYSQTLTTSTAGTYIVAVTDGNGCAGKDTVKLTVNQLPLVSLSNAEICQGSSGAVFTPGTFAAYKWSTGESSASITKNVAGTYKVTVTDSKGCKDSASAVLTVNTSPSVSLGSDRSICPGTATTFDAGTFASYLWNDNSTNQTKTATIGGNVIVEVTDSKGCKAKDTAIVSVKNSLTINLGPDKAICAGDAAVTFDAALTGLNYLWSNGETSQTISTAAAGTYIVNVDDGSGCAGKDTVKLTVNNFPVVNLGADKEVCLGDPMVTFDAGAGFASYGWSNNIAVRNITVGAAGLYSVEVTDNNGCKAKDTIELIVHNLPIVDLGADRSICPSTSTTFDAGTFESYLWNSASTTKTNTVNTAGNVIVTVTDVNGCKDQDTAVVIISNNLTVALGADKEICLGDAAVTFDAGIPSATYSWSSGENTQTISKNVAGSYAVTVTTPDGCTGTDVATLTVNALPVVNMPNQAICQGQTATFTPGTFSSYSWLSGETSASVSKTTTTSVTVKVTDAKGCKNSGSANLTVNPLPVFSVASKAVCAGASTTFDAGAGFSTYAWSTGETTQSISKSVAGPYTVTVTDANNCKNSASATLTVNPLPIVSLGSFAQKCIDEKNFKMSGGAPSGGIYSTVYSSAKITIDSFPVKLMGPGAHQINYEYTDNNGCFNSAPSSVVVNPLPTLSIADKTICAGASATFDAGAGFSSYYWNTATNTRSISTGTAGTYTVVVSDAKGCKTRDTVVLKVNANPIVDLGPDKKACEGTAFTLSSNIVASSYLWNNNATTNSISINKSGKYVLTVSDAAGCTGSDDIQITEIVVPKVDLGVDKQICAGQTVTLNSNQDNSVSVYWSTGSKAKSISVGSTGAYTVQAYYDPTCPAFDTVNVIVIPMPVSGLGNDTVVCFNEIGHLTLDAAGNADQFSWNDEAKSITSSIDVSKEGQYIVQLTNGNICTVTDSIYINSICVSSLFIPNAFTPNADGTNDVFYVKGVNIEKFHLMIFNRWGEMIFESYDINQGWDGTYMENEVQIEVYVWKLDWMSTDAQEHKTKNERVGTVSLIR